jgi:hypothetical protein
VGSCKPLKTAYDQNDLAQLEWVLDSVYSTLRARGISLPDAVDDALKTSLRQKLFGLACHGMTDLEAMQQHLLDTVSSLDGAYWRASEPVD